jgi:hypothetical protein
LAPSAVFARSQVPVNQPLMQAKALLLQPRAIILPNKVARQLSDMLNMKAFMRATFSNKTRAHLTQQEKEQLTIFLRHAVAKTLVDYLSNKHCSANLYHKVIDQSHRNTQLMIGGCATKHHTYVPLVLMFKYKKSWQMTDIAVYTSFLSSAYNLQFKNLLLKKNWPQIMVVIKHQNAILLKKQNHGDYNG